LRKILLSGARRHLRRRERKQSVYIIYKLKKQKMSEILVRIEGDGDNVQHRKLEKALMFGPSDFGDLVGFNWKQVFWKGIPFSFSFFIKFTNPQYVQVPIFFSQNYNTPGIYYNAAFGIEIVNVGSSDCVLEVFFNTHESITQSQYVLRAFNTQNVIVGNWNHFVVTYDGSDSNGFSLYHNSLQKNGYLNLDDSLNHLDMPSNNAFIGRGIPFGINEPFYDVFSNFLIADLLSVNRVLTHSEIRRIFNYLTNVNAYYINYPLSLLSDIIFHLPLSSPNYASSSSNFTATDIINGNNMLVKTQGSTPNLVSIY
jgi:hypothetical protein